MDCGRSDPLERDVFWSMFYNLMKGGQGVGQFSQVLGIHNRYVRISPVLKGIDGLFYGERLHITSGLI